MMKSVEIERAVAPIIAQCLDGIEKAASEINEKDDTMLVIERYKSGFQPPGDFPFEDLSVAKSSYDSNSQLAPPVMQPIHNHLTVKGTVSGGKIKKRVGLFGIFSSNKVCRYFSMFFLKVIFINPFSRCRWCSNIADAQNVLKRWNYLATDCERAWIFSSKPVMYRWLNRVLLYYFSLASCSSPNCWRFNFLRFYCL